MRILYLIPFISLFCSAALNAQPRTLPYTTGFETASERAGWQVVRTGVNHTYSWNYSSTSATHDYPVGGSPDTVSDWLISPPLKITAGARLAFRYSVYAIMGSAQPADQFSVWFGKPANVVGEIVLLADLTDSVTSVFNKWHDTGSIELPYATDTGIIVFRYRTLNNWFTVAVDDVSVTDPHSSTRDLLYKPVQVFPNPAQSKAVLSSQELLGSVSVYTAQGACLYSAQPASMTHEIDMAEWPAGVYLLEARYAKGSQLLKVIKQ